MNLNLTFTAPVRFSIPERFALQGREKKSRHTICSAGPALRTAPAQKLYGSRRSAEAWGWAASGSCISTLCL